MGPSVTSEFTEHRRSVDEYLAQSCQGSLPGSSLGEFYDAMDYAVSSGGKRIRPLLLIHGALAVDASVDSIRLTSAAAALEFIHAYSLIHDDLPAMDDDDMRRGKPSLHKAYDEATAILVGDGLQARAFEILANAPSLGAEQKVQMVRVLARAAGPAGMVGGQYVDIKATDSDINLDELSAMHSLKTGALIRAALALGGIAAGASETQLTALDEYGTHIGLAFQVVDDILDVESDSEKLGKTARKDQEANKPTYVKLLGLEGAKREAQKLLQAALEALDGFGCSAEPLRSLARYIVDRDR